MKDILTSDGNNSTSCKIHATLVEIIDEFFLSQSCSGAEGGEHWDFRFCGFGYLLIGFSVLVFIAVCGFFVFQHLVFGFRSGFSVLVSDVVFAFSYFVLFTVFAFGRFFFFFFFLRFCGFR